MASRVNESVKVEPGCMICHSKTSYFFSKKYQSFPDSPFKDRLKVDYWKCKNCGFVFSKTHQEMTLDQWQELNFSAHHYFENHLEGQAINQPPYADQALALSLLARNGIVDVKGALDYAAGYGTFSRLLSKYFDIGINIFDSYVRSESEGLKYVAEEDLAKYKLVINSAMFEHVLSRSDLDRVDNLVTDDGVLMIHSVICERIPKDSNWFYLAPIVHTAFHTNKSMAILMEQWGYAASIYSPQAKSWFLFKANCSQLNGLEKMAGGINKEIQTKYFYFKPGFVDYWKGF